MTGAHESAPPGGARGGSLLLGYLLVAAALLWGTSGALTAVGAPGPAEPGAVVALAAAAVRLGGPHLADRR